MNGDTLHKTPKWGQQVPKRDPGERDPVEILPPRRDIHSLRGQNPPEIWTHLFFLSPI